MSISEMKADIARLEGELKRAREVLFTAQQDASEVKIGQLFKRVASRGFGRKKKEFEERGRICEFRRGYRDELTPVLRLLKKDGSDSLRKRPIYDYENWQLIPGAE
jgi:hypothetical protein